jgi:S-adenosylmethionine-diacylglycerol 3-amino-3-carboxypropyl transferase
VVVMKVAASLGDSGFFRELNYSSSVEDGRSELTALALRATDRVLTIAGSGARALDLLAGDEVPAEVVALDFNPAQVALTELKLAALRAFDHPTYCCFLGVSPARPALRKELWRELRSALSPASRTFWEARQRTLGGGVFLAGRWERYLGAMAALALPFRPAARRLFAAETLEAQRRLWLSEWETPAFRALLRLLGQRAVWRWVLRDPGVALIDPTFSLDGYLLERFRAVVETTLLRDSAYASLVFFGRHDYALPLHVSARYFERLRARADRVRVVQGSLEAHLMEAGAGAYDAFSLSDFGSYATAAEHTRVWRAVARAARPGARACERWFMVAHEPPPDVLTRDPELERRLERHDDAFVYRFVCGTVTATASVGAP